MTKPKEPKDHDLIIDNTGGVKDTTGDSEPSFSIKANHKATWFCDHQDWFLAFAEWPFREKPDATFKLLRPGRPEQPLSIIGVQKQVRTGFYHIARVGIFHYSLLGDSLSAVFALQPGEGASDINLLETGPEVLGED